MSKKRKRRKGRVKSAPKRGTESKNFVDKDLSLLEFNRRVIEQAEDEETPLLERVRFLSIFHSNLDEFFMKRIGAPRHIQLFSSKSHRLDRMTRIRQRVEELYERAHKCFEKSVQPNLDNEGIFLLPWEQLTEKERKSTDEIFNNKIFPVLTPLAVDPAHPFPHISNLSTSFAVALRASGGTELSFSRVKIPKIFPAWFALEPDDSSGAEEDLRFVSLADIIANNLSRLYPNMEIVATMLFRVTRNIDLERDQEENYEDFVEMVEQELRERRFGEVVRLECIDADSWLLDYLISELEISENEVYPLREPIDFSNLGIIASLNIPELKFSSWTPVIPHAISEESTIFNAINRGDILVHHPYESFTASVERFIHAAAEDPSVRAIKMTLYRTHDEGTIVTSLIRAAEAGKEVVCLIELKARFDEERNINWANRMEDAGIHVVYGIQGLKIHSKLTLVVRQESEAVKCYAHIGTGNYHSQTAKAYTDLGLLTVDKEITSEVVEIFNFLTGNSLKRDYATLLVAPINMRETYLHLIEDEIAHQKAKRPARIIIKCNGLDDHEVINKLYAASQAGVAIDLIVRGICTLKPGVKGLSENIRVYSVVDRFLEHSRVAFFQSGQQKPEKGKVFIGSADFMARNLSRRVEVAAPVKSVFHREQLFVILGAMLRQDKQTWEMLEDGSYRRLRETKDKTPSSQRVLMNMTRQRSRVRKGHDS